MNGEEREVALDQLGSMIEERLKNGQQVQLTVVGNSMYPLFHSKRDSVILSAITGKVKKREVVFYKRNNGQYVLHRMIYVKDNVYSANGDNQYWVESPLFPEQFIGRMIGFYRNRTYYSVHCFWYQIYAYVWTAGRRFRKPMLKLLRGSVGKKIHAWVRKGEK